MNYSNKSVRIYHVSKEADIGVNIVWFLQADVLERNVRKEK